MILMKTIKSITCRLVLLFIFTLFLPKNLAFAEEMDKVWDPEKGTISGYIWFDENEDGWIDPEEQIIAPEIGEIKLYLINENEEIVEEKIVSRLQNGQAHYYFEVEEGKYKIYELSLLKRENMSLLEMEEIHFSILQQTKQGIMKL